MEIHNIENKQSEDASESSSLTAIWKMVIRGLRKIYTAYGFAIFTILFILFLPFLFIPMFFKKQFWLIGAINRWWAKCLFFLIGIPVSVEFKFKSNPQKQYIFCPNHFSYLDIPAMGLNPHNTIFVGKSSMQKVPLFGYAYGKLHITVDRTKLKSKYNTLIQSKEAIDQGKSLVIFPEGGIYYQTLPHMAPLKDGAFRVAIEKQIPLVPVTIHNNWIILPAEEFLLNWHPLRVVFHEPIETTGMTLSDTGKLKELLGQVIQNELSSSS